MLLTTREMAEQLKVNPTTVKRMLADGRIPTDYVANIGGHWRYNGEAIERHLLKQPVELPTNP